MILMTEKCASSRSRDRHGLFFMSKPRMCVWALNTIVQNTVTNKDLTCHVKLPPQTNNVTQLLIQTLYDLLVSFQAKTDLHEIKKKQLLTPKPPIVPVSTSFLCIFFFFFWKHFIYPVEGLDFSSIHPSTAIVKTIALQSPSVSTHTLHPPSPPPVRVLSMGCGSREGAVK